MAEKLKDRVVSLFGKSLREQKICIIGLFITAEGKEYNHREKARIAKQIFRGASRVHI